MKPDYEVFLSGTHIAHLVQYGRVIALLRDKDDNVLDKRVLIRTKPKEKVKP